MTESKPYTILHLSWDAIGETILGPGRYYLVFWLKGIPLGHYWLETGPDGVDLKEYAATIEEVIGPVLGYYVNNRAGVEASGQAS